MFGNNYNNSFGFNNNTMPTSTQPYGYAMNPYPQGSMFYNQQNMQQPNTNQQNQTMQNTNLSTNIIYVNGLEDVKQRMLLPNSKYAFFDNDNQILYIKSVDNGGKSNVETYSLAQNIEPDKNEKQINSKDYVLLTDFNKFRDEFNTLKENYNSLVKEKNNKELTSKLEEINKNLTIKADK